MAAVRATLVAQQRQLIEAAAPGMVVEGRDIGTVVAPAATLKIYLTASEQVRAARRGKEQKTADTAAVQAELARRDEIDRSRAVDPLRTAEDAIIVDTTELTREHVVDRLAELLTAQLEHVRVAP